MFLRHAVIGVMLLCAPLGVAAQVPFESFSRVDITLTPAQPAPNEEVVATVSSLDEDVRSADIIWVLNDEVIAEGIGLVQTSFVAGALGDQSELAVFIRTTDGTVLNNSVTVQPAVVSVSWEADTYTPPFYRGRARYTSGSTIRAQAFVHAESADGERLAADELLYTWRRDTTVLGNQSGRGVDGIALTGPKFLGTYILSVEVTTADGRVLGTAGARISTDEPDIVLYEYDPLTGIQYHTAIGAAHTFTGASQTQISAVPYYMAAQRASDAVLLYDWRINSASVLGDEANPALLTLQLDADEDVTTYASLSIDHNDHLLQSVQAQWQFTFEADARRTLFGF